MKLTLEVFLGYSYEMAYFHPDSLIEAIFIKKRAHEKNNDLVLYWVKTWMVWSKTKITNIHHFVLKGFGKKYKICAKRPLRV